MFLHKKGHKSHFKINKQSLKSKKNYLLLNDFN